MTVGKQLAFGGATALALGAVAGAGVAGIRKASGDEDQSGLTTTLAVAGGTVAALGVAALAVAARTKGAETTTGTLQKLATQFGSTLVGVAALGTGAFLGGGAIGVARVDA